ARPPLLDDRLAHLRVVALGALGRAGHPRLEPLRDLQRAGLVRVELEAGLLRRLLLLLRHARFLGVAGEQRAAVVEEDLVDVVGVLAELAPLVLEVGDRVAERAARERRPAGLDPLAEQGRDRLVAGRALEREDALGRRRPGSWSGWRALLVEDL